MTELRDLGVSGSQRQETNLLSDITHHGVAKHRDMPHDLMDDIRLWGILWVRRVSNILCRAEYSMSKTVQELSLTENSHGWSHAESGLRFQKLVNLSQLRNSLVEPEFVSKSVEPFVVS